MPKPVLATVLLALAVLCAATTAVAQLGSGGIRGRAPEVIDSGLLDFAGQDQTCALGDGTWDCGREARWAAANRIANHWVDCVERARGAGGEIFAVCYLGGVGGPELNAWLVEEGWARAARDYAEDYAAAEDRARAAGRGQWRGP